MRFIILVSEMPQAGLADFGMCLMMGASKTGWSKIEAENEIAAGRHDGVVEVVVMEAAAEAVVVVKVEGEEEVVGIEVLVNGSLLDPGQRFWRGPCRCTVPSTR